MSYKHYHGAHVTHVGPVVAPSPVKPKAERRRALMKRIESAQDITELKNIMRTLVKEIFDERS